jgi:hypothetical protein
MAKSAGSVIFLTSHFKIDPPDERHDHKIVKVLAADYLLNGVNVGHDFVT